MTELQVDTPTDPPPLRIHHILVATAVTAVFLSFARSLQQPEIGGLFAFISSGMGVMYAVSSSLALTALGLGLYWRRRGIAFFHQPGHWLLISHAFGVWVVVLAAVFLVMRPAGQSALAADFFGLFFLALNLAMTCIDLIAAWRVGDTRWWRLLFIFKGLMVIGVFALSMLVFSLGSLQMFALAHVGVQLFLFFLLVGAATNDRRARRKRDWPHWLGVFLSLAVYTVALVPQLVGLIALVASQ